MSSEGSDQMLTLLKELSVYKAMDEDYRDGSGNRAETEAYLERERRRHEIAKEMQRSRCREEDQPARAIGGRNKLVSPVLADGIRAVPIISYPSDAESFLRACTTLRHTVRSPISQRGQT